MKLENSILVFVDVLVSFVIPILLIGFSVYRMISRRRKASPELSIIDLTPSEK